MRSKRGGQLSPPPSKVIGGGGQGQVMSGVTGVIKGSQPEGDSVRLSILVFFIQAGKERCSEGLVLFRVSIDR